MSDQAGCQAVETVTIDDNPAPTLSLVGLEAASCGQSNGSAEVAVTGGTPNFTFTWSGAASANTDETADNIPAGNYIVIVTDANGCTATLDVEVPAENGPKCFGHGRKPRHLQPK